MLAPIFSAILESFGLVMDKVILKYDNLSSKDFVTIAFIFLAIFTLPLIYFYRANLSQLSFYPLLVLILIIVGVIFQNLFFFLALKQKDLSLLEPIRNIEPIVVILMAFLFFPSERSIWVFVLGLIATMALVYSHLEKNQFNKIKWIFDKYLLYAILAVLVASILNIAYKYVLDYINPVALWIIRVTGVAIILGLLIRPKITKINKKQLYLFIISAFFYSSAFILRFIAFTKIGVSITILILTLSPAIIYLSSGILLKEKITKNKIISSVIIIACVIMALFIF